MSSYAPCYEQGEECAVRHAFATGQPHTVVHLHHDAAGNPITVETKAFPLRNEAGEVMAAIEIINDVTEKKRLADQLHHAQKMEAVGLLGGGIAHDFNNVLTAIVGYGNLLKMKMAPDDRNLPFVEQILASSSRASGLTKSLLAFSRKQVNNPRPMDLNDTLGRVEKLLDRIIGEDIEIRCEFASGELTILADSSQMEQVLMNLATNARDAMPQGGTLTIRSGTEIIGEEFRRVHGFGIDGTYATVSMADTGLGMEPAVIKRIFEPYFTTKERDKGTGLGLAIVYGIMKQNSGYITVESEPGKGSRFHLYFPLAAAPEQHRETAGAPGGRETILIAEDDASLRQLMRTVLAEHGYAVIEAADGEVAVQKVRENRDTIRLVLLDVIMPRKGGREVRNEIAGIAPDARVLYITGYSTEILRSKGFTESTEHFIQKPVSPQDLLRTVRQALDRPASDAAGS
jgi:signal transduction histidine kinase/CheY-like chemotaxis protein